MYQAYKKYKILRAFFDEPGKKFQIRELVRKTGVSLPSVRNHVMALEKEGFLTEDLDGTYKGYRLADSTRVRAYKRNDLLARLEDAGLLDFLERKYRPNCIVLYGSAAEGRDDLRGDIDIYIQARSTPINLEKYEKDLSRSISLLFEPDICKLNRELINSLANGITLKGFLKGI
jgi:DNA-binding transcriptional ArsR family regulator